MSENILIISATLISILTLFLLYKNKSSHNKSTIIVVILILLSGAFSLTAFLINSSYSIMFYGLQWIALVIAVILQLRNEYRKNLNK